MLELYIYKYNKKSIYIAYGKNFVASQKMSWVQSFFKHSYLPFPTGGEKGEALFLSPVFFPATFCVSFCVFLLSLLTGVWGLGEGGKDR